MKLPALQGAWFAAPENAGFNAFADRYRAKFNSDPTRLATLSYDAVSLVAALARTQGSQRYTEKVLTNASGFNGADGVFRFRADGPERTRPRRDADQQWRGLRAQPGAAQFRRRLRRARAPPAQGPVRPQPDGSLSRRRQKWPLNNPRRPPRSSPTSTIATSPAR